MDPKEFYQRLSELAEIKQVRVPKGPSIRESDEPDRIFRNGYEFDISLDNNPTLTLAIKKIKHEKKSCEDCGNTVINRQVHVKVCEYPKPHWRETCQDCKKTRNPETGEFELTAVQANNYFKEAIKQNRSISIVKFRKPAK